MADPVNTPVLTVVETNDYGTADGAWFYDAVMDNMPKERPPAGYLFHFAGSTENSWAAISAYDSRAAADETFASRTIVAVPEAIKKTGLGLDLTRELHELDRYVVGPAAKPFLGLHRIRNNEAKGYLFDDPDLEPEHFREVMRRTAFPDEGPPGLILQVLFRAPTGYRIYDIWAEDADADGYYANVIRPAVAAVTGRGEQHFDDHITRLDLHGLSFAPLALGDARRFPRHEEYTAP